MIATTLARPATATRVSSIDVLRGVVMVIMALDHARDYLHRNAMFYNPVDLTTTTPALFATRWLTHFCAPTFVFLAGTAAFLTGQKKTNQELCLFLVTRGLWLIVLELTILNFSFWFDLSFSVLELQVMWAIGASMIVLGGLIFLPRRVVLLIGLFIVFGHNALDGITFPGGGGPALVWSLLHKQGTFALTPHLHLSVLYPVLPWIGVMALGYCFGELYTSTYDAGQRKPYLLAIGLGASFAFVTFRNLNVYGDPVAWSIQPSVLFTCFSFLNVTKYPPSLLYLLMTLGPAILLLYWLEGRRTRLLNAFSVYGRTPLFYYVLHFYVIHLLSVASLLVAGVDWAAINFANGTGGIPKGQGLPLAAVFGLWLLIILGFYPLCKQYHKFKKGKKSPVWSYL